MKNHALCSGDGGDMGFAFVRGARGLREICIIIYIYWLINTTQKKREKWVIHIYTSAVQGIERKTKDATALAIRPSSTTHLRGCHKVVIIDCWVQVTLIREKSNRVSYLLGTVALRDKLCCDKPDVQTFFGHLTSFEKTQDGTLDSVKVATHPTRKWIGRDSHSSATCSRHRDGTRHVVAICLNTQNGKWVCALLCARAHLCLPIVHLTH